TLFIYHKICDVTDLSVARLNVIAAKILSASEMLVFPVLMFLMSLYLVLQKRQADRIRAEAPHPAAIPVRRPAVITVIFDLILAGDRLVRFNRWTVLNLFFAQLYMQRLLGLVQFPKS